MLSWIVSASELCRAVATPKKVKQVKVQEERKHPKPSKLLQKKTNIDTKINSINTNMWWPCPKDLPAISIHLHIYKYTMCITHIIHNENDNTPAYNVYII